MAQYSEGSGILEYHFNLIPSKDVVLSNFTFNLKNTDGEDTAKFDNFRLATGILTDDLISKCSVSVVTKTERRINCVLDKPLSLSANS